MARSRSIGSIYAELSVRDKMTMGLKKARRSLNSFGSASIKIGMASGAALAAGMVVGTKHAISMGAELDHLSTQTGVSVASLMKLSQAYKDNGKDASGVSKDIGKMQKAIFTNATVPVASGSVDYFKEIGLSAQEIMDLSPEEQFFAIGTAIKTIEDPTKRAAAAMGIFGKSGASLITVFQGANLDDVNASLGRMPEIMDRFSWGLERADTLMGRLPNKSDQFFTGFTAGVIGQLLPSLESMNDADFTTLGENLGDAMATAMELITDGSIWEIFSLNAQKAIAGIQTSGAINGLAAGLLTTWEGITSKFGDDFDFGKSFEKNKGYGIEANSDLIDGIDAQITDIMARAGKRAKVNKDRVEANGEGMTDIMTPKDLKDFTNEIPAILKRDVYAKYGETPTSTPAWQETASNVNSMQSRGLGMGSINVPKEVKDQVSLLQQIRDVLKKNSNGGDPAFG